jgi:hypothetical protein
MLLFFGRRRFQLLCGGEHGFFFESDVYQCVQPISMTVTTKFVQNEDYFEQRSGFCVAS